jgi:hypothetical protein
MGKPLGFLILRTENHVISIGMHTNKYKTMHHQLGLAE